MVNITFEFPLLQTDQSQVIVARLKKQVFLDFNVVKINIANIIKLTDRNNYLWLVVYWCMMMVNITFLFYTCTRQRSRPRRKPQSSADGCSGGSTGTSTFKVVWDISMLCLFTTFSRRTTFFNYRTKLTDHLIL